MPQVPPKRVFEGLVGQFGDRSEVGRSTGVGDENVCLLYTSDAADE